MALIFLRRAKKWAALFFHSFFSEVFFFSVNLIVSLSLRSCAVVYIFLGAKILSIYLDSWCKISLKFLKSSTYIILVRKKSLKNLLKKRSDKRVHSFHERAMKECHSLFSKGAMWECHSFFWQGAGAERYTVGQDLQKCKETSTLMWKEETWGLLVDKLQKKGWKCREHKI